MISKEHMSQKRLSHIQIIKVLMHHKIQNQKITIISKNIPVKWNPKMMKIIKFPINKSLKHHLRK
jgi:hypothetical protein